jgi:hypothetical protein
MDQNRILELALEGLQKQKAGIEAELEMIQAELNGVGSAVLKITMDTAADTGRRSRTPAERKAQSERMRQYWAAKRKNAAKVSTAPKIVPAAGPKRKAKTAAEKKALSLKMKEIWKKRKATASKGPKRA